MRIIRIAHLLTLILLPAYCKGALIVDWLTFSPLSTRGQFELRNDGGEISAFGEFALASGGFVPGSPSAGFLGDAYWTASHPFADSLSGDHSLTTTKTQIAPKDGIAAYRLIVTGNDLSGMIFAIGQVFAGIPDANFEVRIHTTVGVNFYGIHGWDDGVRSYEAGLLWNADTSSLYTPSGTTGDSAFAFFEIPNNGVPIQSLEIDFPKGYSFGNGDTVEFAFGLPVPESGNLASVSLAALLLRRRKLS